jgi:hypothetical protein
MLSERINGYYTEIMLDPSKDRKILRISMALHKGLERFCMGNFQTQKLTRAVVLKDAGTFVLHLFKILSADSHALTPRPQKSKFFCILEIFSKVENQKLNVCACLTRPIKPDKKKIKNKNILWWEV